MGVSIATLQGLLEVQDYKVASKAFTDIVAYNCFKVLLNIYTLHRTTEKSFKSFSPAD